MLGIGGHEHFIRFDWCNGIHIRAKYERWTLVTTVTSPTPYHIVSKVDLHTQSRPFNKKKW